MSQQNSNLPTPDAMARELRVRFEKHIPKSKTDDFFMSVWGLAKIVQEQCNVSFKVADEAIAKHFPELYADHWDAIDAEITAEQAMPAELLEAA